mgnify:CR=1 FL=1
MTAEQTPHIPASVRFRMEIGGNTPLTYQNEYDWGKSLMRMHEHPLLQNPYAPEGKIHRGHNTLFRPGQKGIPLWAVEFSIFQ